MEMGALWAEKVMHMYKRRSFPISPWNSSEVRHNRGRMKAGRTRQPKCRGFHSGARWRSRSRGGLGRLLAGFPPLAATLAASAFSARQCREFLQRRVGRRGSLVPRRPVAPTAGRPLPASPCHAARPPWPATRAPKTPTPGDVETGALRAPSQRAAQ